jgi:hypothetical protein
MEKNGGEKSHATVPLKACKYKYSMKDEKLNGKYEVCSESNAPGEITSI